MEHTAHGSPSLGPRLHYGLTAAAPGQALLHLDRAALSQDSHQHNLPQSRAEGPRAACGGPACIYQAGTPPPLAGLPVTDVP